MKRDHTYLSVWIPTYFGFVLIWSFVGFGPVTVVMRLWIHDLALENLARYWITIVVHSVVLAVAMYQAGLRMNAKTKRQSMAGPIGDQLVAIVIPPIVSVITKFSYLVDPYAGPLATVLWGGGDPGYSARQMESAGKMLGLTISQVLLLAAISLGAFALAKRRQERKNPVLNKIREESQQKVPAGELDLSNFELNISGGRKRK